MQDTLPHPPDLAQACEGELDCRVIVHGLVRLLAPPGATVIDPFAGSGSTVIAALAEGFGAIGIEREAAYVEIARERLRMASQA